MAEIEISRRDGGSFRVAVAEGGSATTHEVTVDPADVARFGGGVPTEALIEASFRFLLDREPKESILGRFDLSVIERYFPEYPGQIGDYL